MSLYRNLTWFIKGMREYTKQGYEKAAKSFNSDDIPASLANKVVMVTGANSGLGYECALHLANLGAEVHLMCRNRERGEAAMNEIKSKTQNSNVHLHLADASKVSDVRNFGRQFSARPQAKLDVLVLNAGSMFNDFQEDTVTQLEMSFVTNTLSTFVLGEELIPLMEKTSQDPRVIVMSSGGMLVQKLQSDDPANMTYLRAHPEKYDGTMAYAQQKRQQVIMVEEWAKAHPNVKCYSTHPGWADTPGVSTAMPSFYEKMQTSLRTAAQGADTAIWLAASSSLPQDKSGEFFQDRQPVSKHLMLACTRSSESDVKRFMTFLNEKATVASTTNQN